ncbi:MAG TPA: hypothetical protein EYH30_07210 [Anaerolineales bacterium]|nr:hypothetical protein [Anaerolineae bacterium]HIQ01904.1 hypothetical protein [Anaerolineales bacterium]
MERTVPSTGSEEIELYQRTYYSLLRTTDEVQIRSLVESHARMQSALHVKAGEPETDMDALVYASLRLPPCILQVRLVVMSPSEQAFRDGGYADVDRWEPVAAPGRRRRMCFDGIETLAAFIASRSDIDDLIPTLTAYQIEWNKIHLRLHDAPVVERLAACAKGRAEVDEPLREELRQLLGLSEADLALLEAVWGGRFVPTLLSMARREKRFGVRLLSASYVDYRRAARRWWEHIAESVPTPLAERVVYFISSNTHSLVNLLSGCALRREGELIHFVEGRGDPGLWAEYQAILQEEVPSSWENFLYYVLKRYTRTPQGQAVARACGEEMRTCGIWHVESLHYLDVGAQVIELCALRPEWLDPRVRVEGLELLRDSDALILNIDYPLGVAAYRILAEVATGAGTLRGLYVLGKAATLNGRVGDVMIPGVIHDEHSQNTYLFLNAFTAADVRPYLVYGTVLDNQKAISVRGTFLQNRQYMDVFYREGFTDIEMEAGPYLSAVYEAIRPKRYPVDEIVNLYRAPFEIGILHYASDTPFTRGQTLAEHLSYFGMDATYACSVAILRRILEREVAAVRGRVRKLEG